MAPSMVTLGISPGTRTMGLAVIRDGELIEWRVKTFKGIWSKEKLKYILRAIEKMCDYYRVTAVAMKKVDPLRSSKQLDVLTNNLIAHAKKKHLRIATYSLPELMKVTGRKQKNTHNAIAECVVEIYPGLRREYIKERNMEREYYSKMFEAVLSARMLHVKYSQVK